MALCNQLALSDPSAISSDRQLVLRDITSGIRIRTNILLLKPIRFYEPDNDESVPYAFLIGRETISTANGCEEALLSGYFSALCAVLPDLINSAEEVMNNLGFQLQKIMVPSQADSMNIEFPKSKDSRVESLVFAQIIFLPFQLRFDDWSNQFWYEVAKTVGIQRLPVHLFNVSDMKTIKLAITASGISAKLIKGMGSSRRALANTATCLGYVLSKAGDLASGYTYRDLYPLV